VSVELNVKKKNLILRPQATNKKKGFISLNGESIWPDFSN